MVPRRPAPGTAGHVTIRAGWTSPWGGFPVSAVRLFDPTCAPFGPSAPADGARTPPRLEPRHRTFRARHGLAHQLSANDLYPAAVVPHAGHPAMALRGSFVANALRRGHAGYQHQRVGAITAGGRGFASEAGRGTANEVIRARWHRNDTGRFWMITGSNRSVPTVGQDLHRHLRERFNASNRDPPGRRLRRLLRSVRPACSGVPRSVSWSTGARRLRGYGAAPSAWRAPLISRRRQRHRTSSVHHHRPLFTSPDYRLRGWACCSTSYAVPELQARCAPWLSYAASFSMILAARDPRNVRGRQERRV